MDKTTTCCFTGHRPDKLPWGEDETDPRCLSLKQRLAAALEDIYWDGVRHFICGMARGADLYFAEAVLALRARRPGSRWNAPAPVRPSPTAGLRKSRRATRTSWTGATTRQWCSSAMTASV